MNTKPTRTFDEALNYLVKPFRVLPGRTLFAIKLASIALPWCVGAAIHALADPGPSITYPVAAIAIAGLFAWRKKTDQLGRVDWATAPTLAQSSETIPPESRDAIRRVATDTADRHQSVGGIYLYHAPDDDKVFEDNVAVIPASRRRVIIVGGGVAEALTAEQFEAALRHEMRHTTGIMPNWSTLELSLRISGWFAVGILGYGWQGVAGLWLLLTALFWGKELICDSTAVWHMGAEPTLSGLQVMIAKRDHYLRRQSLAYRITWFISAIILPSHPPFSVRRALALTISGRR